jgi:ParB family chromosome partitioning protein
LEVRNQLLQNRITPGHARAILSLETKEKQKELCAVIIKKGLSVREAESLAKRWSAKLQKTVSSIKRKGDLESQLHSLQDSLRKCLGTKVHITQKGNGGKIEIEYFSHEDLERIVEAIRNPNIEIRNKSSTKGSVQRSKSKCRMNVKFQNRILKRV